MATDKKNQSHKISGTAYYPFLNHQYPDQGYKGKQPNLQISIVPDKESKKLLEGQGVTFLNPSESSEIPSPFVRIKTKIVDRPLRVVDAKNNPVPVDRVLVGNGSKVNVHYFLSEWEDGVTPILLGVQVVDLVEYVREERSQFDETDGFTVGDLASSSDEDTTDDEDDTGL